MTLSNRISKHPEPLSTEQPRFAVGTYGEKLASLQRAHLACRACVDAGLLGVAAPVFSGSVLSRIVLIGQAPGAVEVETRTPFSGRAGRTLMRWLVDAGFQDEAEIRQRIYFTSVTTCFPGKARSGDRKPTAREIELCSHWRDSALELLDPTLVILVGTLALGEYLPDLTLDNAVGRLWTDPVLTHRQYLVLPHPSGQSRWLNSDDHRKMLQQSLNLLHQYTRQ
ncbi:MAG: uracil-DNA glycosylase family protein [Actinobacteria bacterium]|nr:uracil-DNA glycosylase family protein [Actinomycetota bacterium]